MNGVELKKLREWDGDYNGMHRIKTIRVFPPIAGMLLPPPTVSTPAKKVASSKSSSSKEATTPSVQVDDHELPSESAILPEGASIESAVNNEMSVIAATVALGDATANDEQGIQMMMLMEGEDISISPQEANEEL